jgi:hypothetical protein
MRRIVIPGLFALLIITHLSVLTQVALSEDFAPACYDGETGREAGPDAADCAGKQNSESRQASAARETATVAKSRTKYVTYSTLTTGPDGQPCVTTALRPESAPGTNEAPAYVPDGGPSLGTEDNSNLYHTYAPCPQSATPDPAILDTPQSEAARFWERVPLPKPQPQIAPGWAITGKLAYLETNGELQHTYRSDTPFGPLEISATGQYYVDWGDGESSGPHSSEGKAWPDGTITHEYIWAGTYDIVVTERWTASWRIGGRSGTLRELRTTGRINDFPARQIQAVIR